MQGSSDLLKTNKQEKVDFQKNVEMKTPIIHFLHRLSNRLKYSILHFKQFWALKIVN